MDRFLTSMDALASSAGSHANAGNTITSPLKSATRGELGISNVLVVVHPLDEVTVIV